MKEFFSLLHPALVHLPIGFILITIIYEWYKRKSSTALWFVTALSALITMTSGLLLLQGDHFEGLEVFLHLIMGISIGVVSTLIFIAKWQHINLFTAQNTVLKLLLVGLLFYGGHKGAEITHGKNYLHIPLLSSPQDVELDLYAGDSIFAYRDIIKPILERKCIRCHETGDTRGRLNLQTQEGILSDTYGDPAAMPGNLEDSEIYKRIRLAPSNKKYMPPSGEQLTFVEKKLIEWWILDGAHFDVDLKQNMPPDHIKELLLSEYGFDFRKKSFYERAEVATVSDAALNAIASQDFSLKAIAQNTNFVDVHIKGRSGEMTKQRVDALLKAKEQITWLDLSNSDFGDEHASILKDLPNLTKLKLQNTAITDAALEHIEGMKNLNVLNIYGTAVTDASKEVLSSLRNLEKLYIWQTQITAEGSEYISSSNPKVEVVGGQIASN